MSTGNESDHRLAGLIATGMQRGYVLYSELDELLPEGEEEEKEIGDILLSLEQAEVAVGEYPPVPTLMQNSSIYVQDPESIYIDDPIQAYINEVIRPISLMTREQEKEISRRIHDGGPETKKLRREIFEANLGMVLAIAQRFEDQSFQMLDLLQTGNSHLSEAANSCDFGRGYSFSTYATWRVYRALRRETERK